MAHRYLKKAGIAGVLGKDPAAVTRYNLPNPDAYSVGRNGSEEPLWLQSTIARWVQGHHLFTVPESLKPYLRNGNDTMQQLVEPFQEDKLYQLKLYATGYAFQKGSRSRPSDFDFYDNILGRILCNVYALSPAEAIFDSTVDSPARRTARVALSYARAYNAGRATVGLEPISTERLILAVPSSMNIAAEDEESNEVVEEIKKLSAESSAEN